MNKCVLAECQFLVALNVYITLHIYILEFDTTDSKNPTTISSEKRKVLVFIGGKAKSMVIQRSCFMRCLTQW